MRGNGEETGREEAETKQQRDGFHGAKSPGDESTGRIV